jgi:hypothetical protein
VKFGKLYQVVPAWERALFDVTSWRFFKEEEFREQVGQRDFFVAYVLAADSGYRGDIFIFPVRGAASTPRAMARWVLPVPIGPAKTTASACWM